MNRLATKGHTGPSEGKPAVKRIIGFTPGSTSTDIARHDPVLVRVLLSQVERAAHVDSMVALRSE